MVGHTGSINKSSPVGPMSEFAPTNDDLEGFAKFVGISGTDVDLFHEAYYGLDTEIWEEEDEEEIPTSYKSKGM